MHFETIAVHAGRGVDPATGAVAAPIHLSTTFERDADGGFSRSFQYSRADNPGRRALEQCLAALEGGAGAAAFASGMAAVAAAMEGLPADRPRRILLPHDMYFGLRALLQDTGLGVQVETDVVDMTDLAAVEAACARRAPGLVWIETPSNPLVTVTDIAAVAAIGKRHGAYVAVDNTWATPVLQRPLALGADIAIHSLTKYVGGNSDVMAGAVVARDDGPFLQRVRAVQNCRGAVAAPFDSWLALRGIGSLSVRMAAHCAHAQTVAEALARHPQVAAVHYPGLPSHAGHEIARRQMSGFGGMLSVEVRGGHAEAMAVAAAVRIFTRATSLGGAHSLIEHRASIEGPTSTAPEALLRLSIGLEHPEDLVADLSQALAAIA